MREIVLDTETTGLSPQAGHKIVEIGCVELVNQITTGNVFHQYINPKRYMPAEAYSIHGLSEEFLSDKPEFTDIVDRFLEFIEGARLIIHNAEFDINFLNSELQKIDYSPLSMERAIDTAQLARQKFPGAPASLDALCKRFRIENSDRKLHGALLDARLLASVYLELIGGRQRGLSLKTNTSEKEKAIKDDRKTRPTRTHKPNTEELIAHADFVSRIKNSVWAN